MDQVLALRVFVRIVEAGSLTKAAGSLNLPRSTVSKLLLDLEEHLSTRLIARSTRTTAITVEGHDYYDRAVRLLSELDAMDDAARRTTRNLSGRLRIDIGSSLANVILIPALPQFLSRYPDVEIVMGVTDRSVDIVGDGVDCAIRGGPMRDSTLIARRVCELPFVTCATPAYFERFGRPVAPDDVRHHRGVGYFSALSGSPFPFRFIGDERPIEILPPLAASVNESTAHVSALLAGLGIGQSFECVLRPYLADGRLEAVLGDYRPAPMPLHLVYHESGRQNARVRAFCDFVVEVFGGLAPGDV
ncbi:LysR family transcriptional regulator [Acuticoccus sediminis]|uniref:LysR family transcriptional regulator n=1 Tax=Acuticoccus sediminis TaxID=2184697 RepID=UPI001CFD642A|nr:LysR family transcriptional regulator [Acuticoccus sediminis]